MRKRKIIRWMAMNYGVDVGVKMRGERDRPIAAAKTPVEVFRETCPPTLLCLLLTMYILAICVLACPR